jgi:hypothetical protein
VAIRIKPCGDEPNVILVTLASQQSTRVDFDARDLLRQIVVY